MMDSAWSQEHMETEDLTPRKIYGHNIFTNDNLTRTQCERQAVLPRIIVQPGDEVIDECGGAWCLQQSINNSKEVFVNNDRFIWSGKQCMEANNYLKQECCEYILSNSKCSVYPS